MVNEFSELVSGLLQSIVIAVLFLIPIILWRLIRGKAIYQGKKKFDSPVVFYVGMILFGSFGALAFAMGNLIYGLALLVLMCLFIIGLVAYQQGWRG